MTEEQIKNYKIAARTKTALLNKHSIVTENLDMDGIFTSNILDNCSSLSYKCYTTYTELQKEVDDAFKEAIERITNIISEI
jgi:hypothetical protein|nr:MAG TPA: hypothetical protein [Caudoviricetes sp.]